MNKRILEPEIMDLSNEYYTEIEYRDCLLQIGRINKYLGIDKKMIKIFKLLPFKFNSVLDVGCGGGFFAALLAKNFKDAQIVGTDISHLAIDYANSQHQNKNLSNLKFELRKIPELQEIEKSVDIITCTLVLHHMSDEDIISFFKRASLVAKKAIIINDLHRHWLSYMGCSIIIPLFFSNRLVNFDSLLSIRKSFYYKDLEYYLNASGFCKKNYSITWHWPFRWVVKVIL